ncbi:MAG: hypothetical protein MJY84_08690, partial [Bacteroidales bacterium]|nr:hypothetical protein [Bacteroidales bacterium]
MKKFLSLFAFAAALLACKPEVKLEPENLVNVSFVVDVQEPTTKVSFNESFVPAWDNGDEIKVMCGSESAIATWDSTNGVFTASVSGAFLNNPNVTAQYPAEEPA